LDDSDWDADSEVGMDAGRSAEQIVDEVIDAMLERLEESDPVVEWVIDGLLDIVLPRGELAVRIRAKVSLSCSGGNTVLVNHTCTSAREYRPSHGKNGSEGLERRARKPTLALWLVDVLLNKSRGQGPCLTMTVAAVARGRGSGSAACDAQGTA
jgi:hypothetical protein